MVFFFGKSSMRVSFHAVGRIAVANDHVPVCVVEKFEHLRANSMGVFGFVRFSSKDVIEKFGDIGRGIDCEEFWKDGTGAPRYGWGRITLSTF